MERQVDRRESTLPTTNFTKEASARFAMEQSSVQTRVAILSNLQPIGKRKEDIK